MQVSPQAERFSEIHSVEETEEMRERFKALCEAGQIIDARLEPVTVIGPEDHLRKLQDDLRRAGYKKL